MIAGAALVALTLLTPGCNFKELFQKENESSSEPTTSQEEEIEGSDPMPFMPEKPPVDFEGIEPVSDSQKLRAPDPDSDNWEQFFAAPSGGGLTCGTGYTLCKAPDDSSDSKACCDDKTQKCEGYKKNAWCGPKSKENCPKNTLFCGSKKGVDTTCCQPGDKCDTGTFPFEYCRCDQTENCKAPDKVCDKKCCKPDETCVKGDWGVGACQKSCKPTETACAGKLAGANFSICCGAGLLCSPSLHGAPSCYPSPTPTDTPTPTPTVTPTPSATSTPEPGASSTGGP